MDKYRYIQAVHFEGILADKILPQPAVFRYITGLLLSLSPHTETRLGAGFRQGTGEHTLLPAEGNLQEYLLQRLPQPVS
jgi:hypothetical protein